MDLIELIDQWGELAPDREAHISGKTRLTYHTLVQRSNSLGMYLQEHLPDDRSPVMVLGHKEPRHAEVDRAHFATAGVTDRVEIRVGDARQSLRILEAERPGRILWHQADLVPVGLPACAIARRRPRLPALLSFVDHRP